MPGGGLLEGLEKARRKEAANGTRASHKGHSHVAGPIFIIRGAFCILMSVKWQFFISKAEMYVSACILKLLPKWELRKVWCMCIGSRFT